MLIFTLLLQPLGSKHTTVVVDDTDISVLLFHWNTDMADIHLRLEPKKAQKRPLKLINIREAVLAQEDATQDAVGEADARIFIKIYGGKPDDSCPLYGACNNNLFHDATKAISYDRSASSGYDVEESECFSNGTVRMGMEG